MAVAATAAVIGLGEAAYGLIKGGKDKKKAEALSRNRPKYSISPNTGKETALAESNYSNGMSADATRAANEGLDTDLSTTLNTLLKGGGSNNSVAEVLGDNAAGRQKLGLLKDQMRMNQVGNLVGAWRNEADQQDKEFLYNIDAPYKDDAQAIAEQRKKDSDLTFTGLNTLGGGVESYLGGKRQDKLFEKYFGKEKTQPQEPQRVRSPQLETEMIFNPVPDSLPANAQPSGVLTMPDFSSSDFDLPNTFGE